METEIINKFSKTIGILLKKGFVVIPDEFYYWNETTESFVNENFRVDIYPSGKIVSTVEFRSYKDIEKYRKIWNDENYLPQELK